MKRNWQEARAKLEAEHGRCRVCRSAQQVEAAHVVGRTHDRTPPLLALALRDVDLFEWTEPYPVAPDRVLPLCKRCHDLHDSHRLDLQPYLTLFEQLQAVADSQGIENARMRVSPTAYPKVAA